VHGAPCSVTLHLTLRARQHWQALDARRLTERPCAVPLAPSRPAADALRFWPGVVEADAFSVLGGPCSWSERDDSDMFVVD
jgi:hypothetical protein